MLSKELSEELLSPYKGMPLLKFVGGYGYIGQDNRVQLLYTTRFIDSLIDQGIYIRKDINDTMYFGPNNNPSSQLPFPS